MDNVRAPDGASDSVVEKMADALRGLGYDDESIQRTIEAAYEGARDHEREKVVPPAHSTRVLIELLVALGLDRAAASIAAMVFQHVDLSQITMPARTAGDLMDIQFRRLHQLRDNERFPAWIDHASGGRSTHIIYGAHRVLHAVAYRDLNPYKGGLGATHLPPRW